MQNSEDEIKIIINWYVWNNQLMCGDIEVGRGIWKFIQVPISKYHENIHCVTLKDGKFYKLENHDRFFAKKSDQINILKKFI
jgi:hypothetical protein